MTIELFPRRTRSSCIQHARAHLIHPLYAMRLSRQVSTRRGPCSLDFYPLYQTDQRHRRESEPARSRKLVELWKWMRISADAGRRHPRVTPLAGIYALFLCQNASNRFVLDFIFYYLIGPPTSHLSHHPLTLYFKF